jgi:hypothetical protein
MQALNPSKASRGTARFCPRLGVVCKPIALTIEEGSPYRVAESWDRLALLKLRNNDPSRPEQPCSDLLYDV